MSMYSRRRWLSTAFLSCLLLIGMTACGDGDDDDDDDEEGTPQATLGELGQSGVFVGGVAKTTKLVGIHFMRDGDEVKNMQIFVTDGEPGGTAEWFEGAPKGDKFSFKSASGKASIEGAIEGIETDGTVTLDGVERVFF